MSSKGAITISQDELIRMKMRANILPNRTPRFIQQIVKITSRATNINKAKRGRIIGPTTQKTSKRENSKSVSKNLRNSS